MAKRLMAIIDREAEVITGQMELLLLTLTAQLDLAVRDGIGMSSARSFSMRATQVVSGAGEHFVTLARKSTRKLYDAMREEPHLIAGVVLGIQAQVGSIYDNAGLAIQSHFGYVQAGLARRFRELMISGASNAPDDELFHRTRNGREMRSREFLFLTVRQALLDVVNSIRLQSLKERGLVEARLEHADNPDHPAAGLTFPIDAYAQIAAEHLHPRSRLLVALDGE